MYNIILVIMILYNIILVILITVRTLKIIHLDIGTEITIIQKYQFLSVFEIRVAIVRYTYSRMTNNDQYNDEENTFKQQERLRKNQLSQLLLFFKNTSTTSNIKSLNPLGGTSFKSLNFLFVCFFFSFIFATRGVFSL